MCCRRLTSSADETLGFLVTRCCAALMSAGTRALIGEMLQAAVAQLEGGAHVFGDVIAKMATAAGRRMAPLVPELVPRLVVLLDAEEEEEGASERQAGALAAIAAIVAGCPKQCKGAEFTPTALEKASELLSLSDGGGDLFDFSGDDDDDEDEDVSVATVGLGVTVAATLTVDRCCEQGFGRRRRSGSLSRPWLWTATTTRSPAHGTQ